MSKEVQITSRVYWIKIIDMLQQNWALIEPDVVGVVVYFIGDKSGVFDELQFDTLSAAERALRLNGFRLFSDDPQAANFIECPGPPYHRWRHPNGPIYSSGRFWKSIE